MPALADFASTRSNAKIATWIRWALRSGLAIFEQGMISGSNFLLNILLARWLHPGEYGAYALVFSVQILILGFYQAILLEPMCVLSATLGPEQFRCYLGSMLRIQVRLAGVVTALLAVAAAIIWFCAPASHLFYTFLGLVITTPWVLNFWFARYACYVSQRAQQSTQGAFFYTCCILAGLYFLRTSARLSGLTVFLTVGISAAMVSLYLLKLLKPVFSERASDRRQWREHWLFGRWELSKVTFDWISENISYTLTAAFLGVADVGALKAIMALFLPLTHSMAALKRLLLPYLSRISEKRGHNTAAASVWNMVFIYLAGGAIYGIGISAVAKPLFHLLWGDKYSAFAYLVPWVSAAALFGLPAHAIDMGLRAIRSPRSIFTSSCLAATAAIAVTFPLTWAFGIRGAVAAIVLSNSILLVIIGIVFRRKSSMEVALSPPSATSTSSF